MPADCLLPPGSTVAGYGRDSGHRDQDRSVLQQRAEIEAYCRARGLVLVRWFADEARPGSSVVGRDGFLEVVVVKIVARTDGTGEIHYRPLGLGGNRPPAPFTWFPGGRGFKRPAI